MPSHCCAIDRACCQNGGVRVPFAGRQPITCRFHGLTGGPEISFEPRKQAFYTATQAFPRYLREWSYRFNRRGGIRKFDGFYYASP